MQAYESAKEALKDPVILAALIKEEREWAAKQKLRLHGARVVVAPIIIM